MRDPRSHVRRAPRREHAAQFRAAQTQNAGSSDDDSGGSDSSRSSTENAARPTDEEAAPLDFARAGTNTAKSAYLAKVLGPVAANGADFDIFQFVCVLWLWSNLEGKKNAVQCSLLRLTMAGYSFSPKYWHTRHAALVHLVK